MPRFSSSAHHLVKAVSWDPAQPAERVNDHILMSRGTSNSYVVTSPAGDVVINTGMPYQGKRHRERYEQLLGRPLAVKKIVVTQSHPDHVGGWGAFDDPGVEVIAQANLPIIRQERNLLEKYFRPRGARILTGLMPKPEHLRAWYEVKELEQPTLFAERHAFELGPRHFELYSTPSGESLDCLIVWVPEDRTVFTGNLFGALYGALPHFYTPRGDRDRGVPQFLRDIERVIALEPELLITGHDAPIVGSARIRTDLTKIRDAVRYIHDETVKGMNEHKELSTLMREIRLPSHLQFAPGRGPVHWYVRSVWEEYTGWFRMESTTELYGVPPRAIWDELTELAGGIDALTDRARRHVAAKRPLEALHFLDIALSVDAKHRGARQVQIDALEQLIENGEGKAYDEISWLESEIRQAKAALGSTTE